MKVLKINIDIKYKERNFSIKIFRLYQYSNNRNEIIEYKILISIIEMRLLNIEF
jgi:hypothetical protein